MNSSLFRVGELVHVPASVHLLKLDPGYQQITTESMLNPTPIVGVVMGIPNEKLLEVYCRGAKWSIPTRNIYKI